MLRPAWTLGATTLAIGWMVAGPAYTLAGHGRLNASPPWQMFDGVGRDRCLLDVAEPTPDGPRRLDRYGPYGAEGWWDAPMEVAWISNQEHARSVAYALCDVGAAQTIAIDLRCPSPDGWRRIREVLRCPSGSPDG